MVLLDGARRDGLVYAREVYDYVQAGLDTVPPGKRDRREVRFLFVPSEAIMFGRRSTHLTNGQHRTQAMRDQGVDQTVVLRWPVLVEAEDGARSDSSA
ncbi:hypothetical protein [Streptacidiphilus sp. PAMC 29251]